MFGLGLRPKYYREILEQNPAVDFFEIVSENYMAVGGKPMAYLEKVRSIYPVAMHGVGLSIASEEPLDDVYLHRLKMLAQRLEPSYISDHLCWTSLRGQNSHDLLPLAYTEEILKLVTERLHQVQELLGRRFYLENPSAYVTFAANEMGEAEFLAELCRRSGCGVLLDINNLYVNSCNLGVPVESYFTALKETDLAYMHLAGHSVLSEIRIDTHDEPIPESVWDLYRQAVRLYPGVPTVIERDDNLPAFAELLGELDQARAYRSSALAEPLKTICLLRPSESTKNVSVNPSLNPVITPTWGEMREGFWGLVTGNGSLYPRELFNLSLPVTDERGVRVYSEAYFLRLRTAIQQNFPALYEALGEEDFSDLVAAYLKRYPPRGVSIKDVASQLPRYLMEHAFGSSFAISRRAFSDLASLEWAKAELFDAEDAPSPIEMNALRDIGEDEWAEVRVSFSPNMRLVWTAFDVGSVVAAMEAVEEGGDAELPIPEGGEFVYLVYRLAYDVHHDRIDVREAKALAWLSAGHSFREACLHLAAMDGQAIEGQAVQELVSYLLKWIENGLVLKASPAP